jgi:hypothetical protein
MKNKVLCDICNKNESDLSFERQDLNIKVEFCNSCINNNYILATNLLMCKVKISSLEEKNNKLKEALRKIMNEYECKEFDYENSNDYNEFICDDECFLADTCAYRIAMQALENNE